MDNPDHKRHFRMTTLDEVLALLSGERRLTEPNPLRSRNGTSITTSSLTLCSGTTVQGVFFLATSFAGSSRIPWWDEVAYIVKQARKKAFIGIRCQDVHLQELNPVSTNLHILRSNRDRRCATLPASWSS